MIAAGVTGEVAAAATVLGLPRPLLYESWLRLGIPVLPSLGGADVVHAPSVAVPPPGRRPLVVTVHDAAPEIYPEAFTARGRRFHRLGLAAAARRADAIITVSAAAAEEIVANSRVPQERITIVPNGVRPPRIDEAEVEAVLRRHGLWQRRYVLWVGSLEPRKGVGTLVAAMARLRAARPELDVETVLAGYEGWLGEDLVAPEDRTILGGSLHQPGRVAEGELWALYKGATVFAFPSLHEGFGLPVIEAMSQATAVVASDIPALREVAGRAALLVAPSDAAEWADAIEGLLDDEAPRRALEADGLVRSRQFTVEAMVAATREVYRKVGS